MDATVLEVSEGPSFSKLNLSVSHLSFLSVWNNLMISDFNLKILGRKIRKGKWKKRGKNGKTVREKLGVSVPIILRSTNSATFRHLGRRNTDLKTKL